MLINLIGSGTYNFASTLRTQLRMFEEADAMGLSRALFVVTPATVESSKSSGAVGADL